MELTGRKITDQLAKPNTTNVGGIGIAQVVGFSCIQTAGLEELTIVKAKKRIDNLIGVHDIDDILSGSSDQNLAIAVDEKLKLHEWIANE